MTVEEAARRWASTWERGWVEHDVAAITALYAEEAVFLTSPFREARIGPAGVREYAEWAFSDEEAADVRFGEPVVAGDKATVEWWTISTAGGDQETLAGVSLLRFDPDGRVAEQYDYWHMEPGARPPHEHYGRWGRG